MRLRRRGVALQRRQPAGIRGELARMRFLHSPADPLVARDRGLGSGNFPVNFLDKTAGMHTYGNGGARLVRHDDFDSVDAALHIDPQKSTLEKWKRGNLSTSFLEVSSMCCGSMARLFTELLRLITIEFPPSTPQIVETGKPRLVHMEVSSTSIP